MFVVNYKQVKLVLEHFHILHIIKEEELDSHHMKEYTEVTKEVSNIVLH
jgi:hypothetical protein